MVKEPKQAVLVVMFLFVLLFNTFIFLGNRKANALTWSDALKYCAMCINIGCTSGQRKCAEFHPNSNTTVTCYESVSPE